ncbi:MAG: ATP-binding protein [Hydrogenophaga sp.]|uniref:sensor histidine kinase n=1 Tax=Hydrogenophaga sp. TaxID=1904254 RepID=UPI002ABC7282|nr:ATP-binding protein [Hydrogenophaga sp.]MDZ4280626.1 ATP-binding protein [Hydrogenophaga sp.]
MSAVNDQTLVDLLLVSIETVRNREAEVIGFNCVQKDITTDTAPLQGKLLAISQLDVLKKLAGAFTVSRRPGERHYSVPKEVRTLFHLPEEKSEWTLEEIGGIVFDDDAQAVALSIARTVKSGEPVDVEFRIAGDDGSIRWIRCHSVSSEYDSAGKLPHCWSIQDVTPYRTQMAVLNNQLELRNRQLAQANRALTEFAYALSHDLRRPVRHVHSYAELLKEALQQSDSSMSLDFAERIQLAATTMANLIDRMLSFSQVGYRALEYVEIDQGEFISDLMTHMFSSQGASKVQWRITGELPPVFVDKVLWQTLWINLIDNAIKYSAVRAVVEIEFFAERVGHQLCYCIKDNGIGFNPDGAKRMFEIFQRLTSDERFEGSGIGLAQARRIIEAHGGTIYAQSQPDCGATFCITLPTTSSAAVDQH